MEGGILTRRENVLCQNPFEGLPLQRRREQQVRFEYGVETSMAVPIQQEAFFRRLADMFVFYYTAER
jgi:hypothetical protein